MLCPVCLVSPSWMLVTPVLAAISHLLRSGRAVTSTTVLASPLTTKCRGVCLQARNSEGTVTTVSVRLLPPVSSAAGPGCPRCLGIDRPFFLSPPAMAGGTHPVLLLSEVICWALCLPATPSVCSSPPAWLSGASSIDGNVYLS